MFFDLADILKERFVYLRKVSVVEFFAAEFFRCFDKSYVAFTKAF